MRSPRIKSSLVMMLTVVYFFLFLFTLVYAQQVQKDISVSIILPSAVNASNYTKFIRITNNDDVPSVNDNLSVFVRMTLLRESDNETNESKTLEWNVTKTINSYSESGFGTLCIEANSTYVFCAEINALNFADYNIENNFVCTNISTKIFPDDAINGSRNNYSGLNESNESGEANSTNETEEANGTEKINETVQNETINSDNLSDNNITCDSINETNNETENVTMNNETVNCGCNLRIQTNKEIFADGEKIEFQIFDCSNNSKYLQPIEYWVEDSGGIAKQILNTTSKTAKTYTPSIDNDEKYFLIKSRIQGCENTVQKLVVFIKELQQETQVETFIQLSSSDEISISSQNEIIYAAVSGYKGDSSKTLVSVWLEEDGSKLSEVTKFYVNEKNSYFNFKVPIMLDVSSSGKYSLIAEGLDEKEENKITITLPDEEEIKLKEEKTTNTKTSETKNNLTLSTDGKITSFYTRKKIFEKDTNITVYISVDYPEGKTLKIYGDNYTVILENISEKNTINISLSSENETIRAELLLGIKMLDYLELKLNMTVNQEEQKTENQSKSSQGAMQTKNIGELFFYKMANQTSNQTLSGDRSQNQITGEIVSVQPTRKNLIFAFVAIVICFSLFNRKLRTFLFKKTKLFK